jgi:hypothetical protein
MTDDNGDEYVYSAEAREGVAYINDLIDVASVNRVYGSTLAWDGFQYTSALYPEEGVQGPEGPDGPIGPDGLIGPIGEQGPVGEQGPQGPEGSVGIPAGGIIMWSGSLAQIPPTWLLCDGTGSGLNKTPDLRDRFVMGAGHKNVGETGGGTSGATAISTSQMPRHQHDWSGGAGTTSDGSHGHSVLGTGTHTTTVASAGAHIHIAKNAGGHSHSGTTAEHTGHKHVVGPMVRDRKTAALGGSGSNYIPDAAGKLDSNTGGAHSHSLSTSSEPNHQHEISERGTHSHTVSGNGSHSHTVSDASGHSHSFSVGGTTTNTGSGSGHTHSVVPSYYTLAYIMKEYTV